MSKSVLFAAAAVSVLAAASAVAAQTREPPAQPQRPATPPAGQPQGQARPAGEATPEVVVTGQRAEARASIDRLSYNVANDLQATTGSIADALRNVPGVEVDVRGNVSLRGDSNVTILIDGRPSGMFRGEGRGDALQNLPASSIERVEVITNPSAAFSPEGTAGVINLVMKQTRRDGRSGSVRGSIGQEGRWSAGVSGAVTRGPLTVSGDLGVRRQTGEYEMVVERERLVGGQFLPTRVEGRGESVANMGNARLGVDYDLNARDRVSAEATHRTFQVDPEGSEFFEGRNAAGVVNRSYVRESSNDFGNSSTGLRTSWRRRYDRDHEIVADLRFDKTKFDREVQARRDDIVPAGPYQYERLTYDVDREDLGAKLDYSRPLGEGQKLRIGYEGEQSAIDYDNFGARGPTPGALAVDPALTNRFLYDQTIHAVYGTYERPFGKLTAQFGLRLEQVNIDMNQVTDGIRAENDYGRAYPTLHLNYDLSQTQRLRGSYSRRVQRPNPQDLNPYTAYLDPQTLRRGNPNLDPEITDSFELGWQYRQGQAFYLVTAFHRVSTGGITDVLQDQGGGVFLITRENLDESRRTGLEVVANGRINPQLSYSVSGMVAWNEIDAAGFGERSGTTSMARANLNWNPTQKDFFQINGFMMGRQLQAQGWREASGMLNIGYRRKVTEKFSLVFTGQNILDSFREKTVLDTPTLRGRSEMVFMRPSYFIGFTYSFGDGQQQQRRREPTFEYEQPAGPAPTM